MKYFIQNTTKFVLKVSILLLVVFVSLYHGVYKKNRLPYVKNEYFKKYSNQYDSINLVLGSSHTVYGVNVRYLEGNFFNSSSVSQSLMEDYLILKNVKNPVKKVIIPISYFSNWHFLYNTKIVGERIRILDYMNTYNIEYPKPKATITEVISIIKSIRIFLSELVKNTINKKEIKIDNFGNMIDKCDSKVNEIKDAKVAFDRHNLGKNFNNINPYLDSINTFCTKNKIDLYIIAMPYTHDYRKYTSEAGFDKYLKKVKEKYNNKNCFLMDFRSHFKLSEERFMFRDADHLSFCGSIAFSKYLYEQINFIASKSNQTRQGSN